MVALREVIYRLLFCPSTGGLCMCVCVGGQLIDGVVVHSWSLTQHLPLLCLKRAWTWLVA